MADGFGEEAIGERIPNWGYYEANFLVKYGPMKKYNVSYHISDEKKAQYMGKHRRKAQ